MVYVINKSGKPLMPCKEAKAKNLLKHKKAKCIGRIPFTIKLLWDCESVVQDISLGIDSGSSKIGSSAVSDKGDVIYLSEIKIRNDIADKMKQRSKYRRNRRNRKTRYREARWLNRRNSIRKNRFSPTMDSKINSHLKEISFVKYILPITNIIIETGNFDPHALKNPNVLNNKLLYQQGINYGLANTKAYILTRDDYTCKYCKGKSKDNKLEVHHIIFRRDNGSNEHSNLITLCKTCHDNLHKGNIKLSGGKIKGQLRYATQMNSIRQQLLKIIPEAEETFGYITKEHRQLMDLPKEHYTDAIAIANLKNIKNSKSLIINIKTQLLLKVCVSKGDYQQTRGIRSEQKINTRKIQGFRKFDKISYLGNEYFIKGRMSRGYAILMDIDGIKVNLKPIPKFIKILRLSCRKSWITLQNNIGIAKKCQTIELLK